MNNMISVHSMKKVEKLRAELAVFKPLRPTIEDSVLQKIRIDWNYHAIAGDRNSLSFEETKTLVSQGTTRGNKPLKDYVEMKVHNDAISWMFEIARMDFVMTEDFIKKLHESILVDAYELQSYTKSGSPVIKLIEIGKYKQSPNNSYGQSGKILDFTTPDQTPGEMAALIDWFATECNRRDVDPIKLATEFHYRFVKIHPFEDANGRIARLLTNLILMRFDYPPVVIRHDERNFYSFALQEADKGKMEMLYDLFARAVAESLELYLKAAKGESLEEADSLEKDLAVLEQRLRKLGSKIVKREKIVVLDIFDRAVFPLLTRLCEQYARFDRFYIDKKLEIVITSLTNLGPNGSGEKKSFTAKSLTHLRELLLNEPLDLNPSIFVNYSYTSFNRDGFAGVEYSNRTVIHFDELEYKLTESSSTGVNTNFVKKYSEEITSAETEAILLKSVDAHKSFIEQKIESIERVAASAA